jgi:hypothetical protein
MRRFRDDGAFEHIDIWRSGVDFGNDEYDN